MEYTLAFDVYGTLIDTSGILKSLTRLTGETAKDFMDTWRNKQLEYAFRRGLMNSYVDFSECTSHALNYSCLVYNIPLKPTEKESLLQEYSTLPAFEDVTIGLEKLKAAGHHLFAFSNGSKKTVSQLLQNSKILNYFKDVVSVADVETFKPNPAVYTYFNTHTNSTKTNSWLISSNPFDVIGAISYGMRSAWVKRSENSVFDPWGIDPTLVISSIAELDNQL
nr:haloacid dehalogenase type II [Pseudopedobacter sp.]